MAKKRDAPRDWHRVYGLLWTDFFKGSPFLVEVERDMSQQQQYLDAVIVRRGQERFRGRLPDGMDGLVDHNLMTFKSHHEALDSWAMKELIGHYVSYRKLVSPSPSRLLPEDHFRLYAVCARFPHNLSGQVPRHERQAGMYDCQWGHGHGPSHRGWPIAARGTERATASVQRRTGIGGVCPRYLPTTIAYKRRVAANLEQVSKGGDNHAVHI